MGSILVFAAAAVLPAQELSPEEMLPEVTSRVLVLHITARVMEPVQREVWNSASSRLTLPGRPVGVQLMGSNIVVVVSFTPYRAQDGSYILVAQGQIWLEIPGQGVHYQTTIETIPIALEELIYFFPLGRDPADSSLIEISVAMSLYTPPVTEGASAP
jgi:hypothetical protein